MKIIIEYDIDEEEMTYFPWPEDRKVPPLIKPKIKKKEDQEKEEDAPPS